MTIFACATFSYLPATSEKYPSKPFSSVETYSFENCPYGTKIGEIKYDVDSSLGITEEQKLEGVVRKAATIGADFICYSSVLGIWENYSAFVRPNNDTKPLKQKLYKIEVVSNPPGANIELNNGYVGKAPLTLPVYGSDRGNFLKSASLVGLPVSDGHCSQIKNFMVGDEIPTKIFFDMRLCPINRSKIDVNINK